MTKFTRIVCVCALALCVTQSGTATVKGDAIFQRAVKAIDAGRLGDAEHDLRGLLRRYPKSVAVLNNLAVVLVKQGRSDQAIAMLRRALGGDKNLFTTYRNLTAIYEQKAAVAYQRALGVRTKAPPRVDLHLVKRMDSAREVGASGEAGNEADAAARRTLTVARAVLEDESVDKPYVVDPDRESNGGGVSSPAGSAGRSDKEKTAAGQRGGHARVEQEALIVGALERWADAWSDRNVSAYYASYVKGHAPGNMTHKQWKKQRASRLRSPRFIDVTLKEFVIDSIEDGVAQVEFVQHYRSSSLSSKTRKRLLLRYEGNGWKIMRERVLQRVK